MKEALTPEQKEIAVKYAIPKYEEAVQYERQTNLQRDCRINVS
jgi:hypothetical protein